MENNLTLKDKLEIAKWLVNNNDGCLTGSLMLYLRGYKLNREPHDIDIVVKNFDNLKLPPLTKSSDDYDYPIDNYIKFEYMGITIDFFIDENTWNSSNRIPNRSIRLSTTKDLCLAKFNYLFDNNANEEYRNKTNDDLISILKQNKEFLKEAKSYYLVKENGNIEIFEPLIHSIDGWFYQHSIKKPYLIEREDKNSMIDFVVKEILKGNHKDTIYNDYNEALKESNIRYNSFNQEVKKFGEKFESLKHIIKK